MNFFFTKIFQVGTAYNTIGTQNQSFFIHGADGNNAPMSVSIIGIERDNGNEISSLDYCNTYALEVMKNAAASIKEKKPLNIGLSVSGQGQDGGTVVNLADPAQFFQCTIVFSPF